MDIESRRWFPGARQRVIVPWLYSFRFTDGHGMADLTLVKGFCLHRNAHINQTLKGLPGPSRLSPEAKGLRERTVAF